MSNACKNNPLRRSLLEMAQVVSSVFETEIPHNEGLPPYALPIMRILCWGGAQSRIDICSSLNSSLNEAYTNNEQMPEQLDIFENLINLGLICATEESDDSPQGLVDITPIGIGTMRRIINHQQDILWRATNYVEEKYRPFAARVIEQLTCGLSAESDKFSVLCTECWAYDQHDCEKNKATEHCAFQQVGKTQAELEKVLC